jgi:hypothetical protein
VQISDFRSSNIVVDSSFWVSISLREFVLLRRIELMSKSTSVERSQNDQQNKKRGIRPLKSRIVLVPCARREDATNISTIYCTTSLKEREKIIIIEGWMLPATSIKIRPNMGLSRKKQIMPENVTSHAHPNFS